MESLKRTILITLAVAFLLPAASIAQTELDMTVNPTALFWAPMVAGSPTNTFSGGVLTIDSAVGEFSGYSAPAPWWPAAATNPGGFEIEAEMRLTAQPQTNSASQGGAQVIASTGSQRFFLEIYTDHIELAYDSYTGTTSYAMDTMTDFHSYHIRVVGSNITVDVDGVPRLSATNLSSFTQQRLDFGDLLYANHTTSEWRYVAFGPTGVVSNEEMSWSSVKDLYR
jgi:hypothetical protein